MITAALNHNPYLQQTYVMFNGNPPRINSQVEKYDTLTLKDWIEKIPQIFHDEMNGYDFDLNFTGTKSDFECLCETFARAGISQDMVRLFHKNELEDAETKSAAIDALVQWLRDNPNRKFDFEAFYAANEELLVGAYPYIVLNGHMAESIHPQVNTEPVKTAQELQNTILYHTPILFLIEPDSLKQIRSDLVQILHRRDVQQNQLFFLIHPQMNAEQIKRIIIDLGVEEPQIITSYGAEEVLMYLRNYPITEFIRNAIRLFEDVTQSISSVLETENKESLIQNAEIHELIDNIEQQIVRLKESDLFFTERDNFSVGHAFADLAEEIKQQLLSWRERKTKVVGDSECAIAAAQYDADIARFTVSFVSAVKDVYRRIAADIRQSFHTAYKEQGLETEYRPEVTLTDVANYPAISVADELLALQKVTYEEQRDLKALFNFAASKEEKKTVKVVTCYYAQWREAALKRLIPVAEAFLGQVTYQLEHYYNSLADAYHEKLTAMIAAQELQKDDVSSQLSDDERKLQEDNDWLAEFKDQLLHIERG